MNRGPWRLAEQSPEDQAFARDVFARYFDPYEQLLLGGASLAQVLERKIADDRRTAVYEAEKASGVHRIAADATTSVSDAAPARARRRR